MKRLTEAGYTYHSCDFMEDGVYELANRLAEYEDTGLTPEQIRKLKERSTEKKPIEHITKSAPMYECPSCGSIDVYGQEYCDYELCRECTKELNDFLRKR